MIDRRDMLAGGALFTALPLATPPSAARGALPVPAGDRLGFDIMRKGSKLGTHILTFEPRGDGLAVHVAVEIAYRFAGITLYHYTHHATESWSGDQVVGLDAATDDNGTRHRLAVRREAGGLVVQGDTTPRYVAPANAWPATHWNRRELDGPWINTQDGRLMRPRVAALGMDMIPTAGDGRVRARRFSLTGDVQLDMWYEDGRGWAGLSFTKGGAEVRYERQS